MYRNSLIPAIDTSGIALTAADPATARYPTVVLGAEAASLLGIHNLARPAQVWIGGHWFTVTCILNRVRLLTQMDSMASIGFPIAGQYFGFDGHPTQLYVRADPAEVSAVAAVLPATVSPADPSLAQVSFPSDILQAEVAAKGAFSGLFLCLGAVALLVGGVGIAGCQRLPLVPVLRRP